ncbi:hypothetical protein AB395_000060 [Sinorhizobium fredii CCBAU 45436]|nr:hypothetical protein AB395_000060 [Sinorhizobium fredii CCBAU 45436]
MSNRGAATCLIASSIAVLVEFFRALPDIARTFMVGANPLSEVIVQGQNWPARRCHNRKSDAPQMLRKAPDLVAFVAPMYLFLF